RGGCGTLRRAMSDALTANPGGALKARYTLHERLGSGGQGEVWRAHDSQRGLDIALKILHPAPGRSATAWAALLHEYQSASRLDHPGVLKVFPPEREDGALLLPMELACGGDLRRLRGSGYLAIVPVLLEIAQALEHAQRMPAQLGALLERMLAKDASERPASMREIIDELDVALNDTLTFDFETAEPPREAPLANPTGPPDRPPPGLPSVSPNPPSGALAPGVVDGQALWEELRQSAIPQRSRLEPMSGHAPRVLLALAGLTVAAFAAFFWLPRYARLPSAAAPAPFNGARDNVP